MGTTLEVLVIGGTEELPILTPAMAIKIEQNNTTLAEAIDLGHGPQIEVPTRQVIEFDEDLQMAVNRLSSTAIDSINTCRNLIRSRAVPVHKNKLRGRTIGFNRN